MSKGRKYTTFRYGKNGKIKSIGWLKAHSEEEILKIRKDMWCASCGSRLNVSFRRDIYIVSFSKNTRHDSLCNYFSENLEKNKTTTNYEIDEKISRNPKITKTIESQLKSMIREFESSNKQNIEIEHKNNVDCSNDKSTRNDGEKSIKLKICNTKKENYRRIFL